MGTLKTFAVLPIQTVETGSVQRNEQRRFLNRGDRPQTVEPFPVLVIDLRDLWIVRQLSFRNC